MTPTYDHWMTGNLVADLIKKKDIYLLDTDVQLGIFLHYEIDTFTDSHPLVSQATRLLHPTQGKYSPVGTDLIWDLCLAKQWSDFSEDKMESFITSVHTHLAAAADHLETSLADRVRYLLDQEFLTQYTRPDLMQLICEKIHKRTRFKSNLDHLMDDYLSLEVEFNSLFSQFFIDLNDQIAGWKVEILSNHVTNDLKNDLITE